MQGVESINGKCLHGESPLESALNIKISDEYSFLTIFKHYPVYLHR